MLQINSKYSNPKKQPNLKYNWNLKLGVYLEFGAWNLEFNCYGASLGASESVSVSTDGVSPVCVESQNSRGSVPSLNAS
jgi:hypothetical protein